MSYPEQQMQNFIEAGLSEAGRCYARIAELEQQNAELVAKAEKMRSALELAFISVKTCYKQDWAPYRDVVTVEKAIKLSPKNSLRDIQAEAGFAGYCNGFKDGLIVNFPEYSESTAGAIDLATYHIELSAKTKAKQYAERVKAGDV